MCDFSWYKYYLWGEEYKFNSSEFIPKPTLVYRLSEYYRVYLPSN